MRVIEYSGYGGPDVLQLVEHPSPSAGPGEVRVRMQCAGISPIDIKLRAGELKQHFDVIFPKVPGRDGVGVIDQIGPSVTAFAIGDAVCVMAAPTRSGTYSEMVVCHADSVVPRPRPLSDAQAAALMQPGLSAWIALMEAADLKPGMSVLIHGGSGAVGSLMIQLARHMGARVSATCSAKHIDLVLGLGAQTAIAYDRQDFTMLTDQDIVFDLIGGETHARSYQVLKKGGQLVYLTAAPIVDQSADYGVTVKRAMITDNADAMRAVGKLADEGVFQPVVARVYRLEEAALAHADWQQQKVSGGRLVLRMG